MCVRALQATIALVGMATVSCSDATGGGGLISLCPQATWAALQREGESWESIPVTRSTHPLGAGERIGLARIRGHAFPWDSLQIYYVTAEQAEATFDCSAPPTKQELHGTTRGIGSTINSFLQISPGYSEASATGGWEEFTLREVPGGPVDLVATATGVPATIIRRGVDYPDGSAIPVLDFGSAEAFALPKNTVTAVGTDNYEWDAASQVITQRGTKGELCYQLATAGTSSVPTCSMPENKLLDGEFTSLTVTRSFRTATVFFRSPADHTLEVGPNPSGSTATRTGTSANPVTRFYTLSQPEYGSQITLLLCAPFGMNYGGFPSITASKEYFGGTPATWSFTLPDFRGVGGFPFDDLRAILLCDTIVTDRPYLFRPADGASYRSARLAGILYGL